MSPKAHGLRPVGEPFEEKDFYLEEFRGRSVLIAIGPEVVSDRADLAPIAATVADLVRNDTRVVLWWPTKGVATDRRLTTALVRARAIVRRRPSCACASNRRPNTSTSRCGRICGSIFDRGVSAYSR
jgi:hypothetical protein